MLLLRAAIFDIDISFLRHYLRRLPAFRRLRDYLILRLIITITPSRLIALLITLIFTVADPAMRRRHDEPLPPFRFRRAILMISFRHIFFDSARLPLSIDIID
jgi:hypothetical protein